LHPISDIMKIKSFKGGFDDNFCYLVWCKKTNHAVIIDPSVEPLEIFEFIESHNIIISKIFITHTHHDHICYLSDFIYKYPNISIYAYTNTRKTFNNNFIGVEHNDIISIGEIMFTALFTPGHYDDCLCYWNIKDKLIFTGDTIFVGRSGRTVSTHSNISKLYNSIYKIILQLPLDTTIYPGHDYGYTPQITIEKNNVLSSFFSCKSEEEFIKIMKDFEKNRL